MSTPNPHDPGLAADIRRRAGVAAIVVAARGLAIRGIGFIGLAVVARLLGPHDTGVVAIGTAVVLSAAFLADAGMAAGLIRQPDEPSTADLRGAMGLQLLTMTGLALLIAAVAAPLGTAGEVTAAMASSLPLLALRTPSIVVLERALDYTRVAAIELAETVAFYAVAIGMVAGGLGVWGYAAAAPARAVVGVTVVALVGPVRVMRPKFDRHRMAGLLRFGLGYQAVTVAQTVRDQGLNALTAAIGGLTTLGLWSVVTRLLQIPFLLFASLWRVSFPAMAQMLQTGEAMRPLLERGARLAAAATGVLLVGLIASAPVGIPLIFGAQWRDATDAVAGLGAGLQVSGPISVAAAGYLYARGATRDVLMSTLAATATWFAIALPLLPSVGVGALGIGGFAGALVESAVLASAVRRLSQAQIGTAVLRPAAAAALAGGLGWALARHSPATVPALLGLGAGSIGVYLLALALIDRSSTAELGGLARNMARRARGR